MNKSELKIKSVNTLEFRSGIPIQSWENVKSALEAYGNGTTKSKTAKDHNIKTYRNSYGGIGAALFKIGNSMNQESFVDKLLQDAKPSVDNRGRWSRHYDYDGPGNFHKTTVGIRRLPNLEDGYLLSLDAAYVGKQTEDGLARALGIEQGLLWKSVEVKLVPEGKNFRINFDDVADRLRPLYEELEQIPAQDARNFTQGLVEVARGEQLSEKSALTGEAIVRTFLLTNSDYTSGPYPFVLGIKNGVEVSLRIEGVSDRFNWRKGNEKEELWQVEGAILHGPRAEIYSNRGGLEIPLLTVDINPYSKDIYDELPAIDPDMKATMNDLAKRVAAVFQPL